MNLSLSPSELSEPKIIQRNVASTPCYVKVTCLMLSRNCSPFCISDFFGVATSTVYHYLAAFTSGSVDSLLETRYKEHWGMLVDFYQLSAFCIKLKTHLCIEVKGVCNSLITAFGIGCTPQGVAGLLNRIGFTYKHNKEIPCEANLTKQEEFVQKLSIILDEKDTSSVVYYTDGVHSTHNSCPTYAWINKEVDFEQSTVSGCGCVNINGLFSACDVIDVIALEQECINAQSAKELYQAALEDQPEAACIYIIFRNARYYKNIGLAEWVNRMRKRQLFLPPYSPNLNLIDRLWRFLRKKVINTGFYRTKEKVREALSFFFEKIP